MRIKAWVFVILFGLFAVIPSGASAVSETTVVAVGDIARLGGGQAKTAQLTKNIDPDQVILIGDIAYKNGATSDFNKYFLPKWKPLLTKVWAVPGNHEYRTKNAGGYRKVVADFGFPKTGTNLWWSKNLDGWTIIGLDSEVLTGVKGASQIAFLKQTLVSQNGRPTIVTWHRPTYSRGEHGNQSDTKALWNIVSKDSDVKLVLWGHDHNYEQVTHEVQVGTANQHKLTTIVIGTGGAELRKCKTKNIKGELICGTKNNYGIAKLVLRSNSFSWSYRNADGSKLGKQLDAGLVRF